MKGTDGILALLQDLKELLYGIAWLILGGILCVTGAILFYETTLGGLLILVGIGVCIGGILYACHGHSHHEVIEHQDD